MLTTTMKSMMRRPNYLWLIGKKWLPIDLLILFYMFKNTHIEWKNYVKYATDPTVEG